MLPPQLSTNTDQPLLRQRRDDAVNACVVGQVQLVEFYPQWLSAETKTGAQQGVSSSDAPEKADNHYGNV